MKFSLETLQRDFFRKNNAIELEALLSSSQLALLQEGIAESIGKSFDAKEAFFKGRDLWRSSEKVKRIAANRNLAELVFQLTLEKPIRLGFDQLLPAIGNSREENPYPLLFKKENLRKSSSIQELMCLLIICVNGEGEIPDFASGDPFPSRPGNGVFLSHEYIIDFQHLLTRKNQSFFMIGYSGLYSQYLLVEEDPQVHALKKHGYVFGDNLHDGLHPILLR